LSVAYIETAVLRFKVQGVQIFMENASQRYGASPAMYHIDVTCHQPDTGERVTRQLQPYKPVVRYLIYLHRRDRRLS